MNITLKERLDLQRTARIITESQYNKLLKEDEMSPETIVQEIPKIVAKFENSPKIQKVANDIANDPKAMAALKNLLTKNGINPLSLNEDTEDIAKKLAMSFMKKAENAPEPLSELWHDDDDVTAEVTLGLAGFFAGGTLAGYIASLSDVITPAMQSLGQAPSHMAANIIGALIGAAITAITVKIIKNASDYRSF